MTQSEVCTPPAGDAMATAIPADVAAQLWSLYSDDWCIRLIDELLDLMKTAKDNGRHERIAEKMTAVILGAEFIEAERRKLAVRTFAATLRSRIDADIDALLRVAQ